MKMPMYEDIPRWYSLFWDFEAKRLCIRIHTFFIAHIGQYNCDWVFDGIRQGPDFMPLLEKCEARLGMERFGMNDSIVLIGQDDEWLTYQVKLPCIRLQTAFACTKCEGTGMNIDEPWTRPGRCEYCRGSKKQYRYVFDEVTRVCVSLSALFRILSLQLEEVTPTELKQLFILTTCTGTGVHAHSTGGYATPTFVRFLEGHMSKGTEFLHLPNIQSVMSDAYGVLFEKTDGFDDFRAYISNGQAVLSCPGNACELNTEQPSRFGDRMGSEISCHNLDSGIQQLTLLAGFAALATLCDQQNIVT